MALKNRSEKKETEREVNKAIKIFANVIIYSIQRV